MKYFFQFVFSLCLAASASAQKEVKDTTANVTDSTLIISARDLMPLYAELKKLPYEQALPFIQYLERLVAVKAEEYRNKYSKAKQ